jgi:hypothetical protein
MDKIVEEGRRFAATADMNVSDMSAQAPVGTTLALLERQLKVMSAVQARLHYTFKQELRLLAAIIRDYTEPNYDYDPIDAPRKAKQSDYDHIDIIPVSDPNAATMSQRVVQYQAVIQMAQMAPEIYDLPQLHRRMLEVLGIKNPDKLIPLPDDEKPKDPVSENMAMLRCEPMKAFMHQDHDSHIKVHMSMINDPLVQQLVGQNPKAAQMQGAMMAHIAEHVGYLYRQKIEQQLGLPLPPEDEKLPPEIELALSGMMAQAANQVLQQSQGQAAQAQAQQQAQDPVLQMQQQELAIKQGELALKQKKIIADAAAQADRLKLDEKKMMIDAADKADRNRAAQGEDPRVAQARAQQEMSANESRQQQELAAMQSRTVMAAQQHNQNLTHKQQVHRQNLEHQREQAAIRAELARNQPEEKPKK